MNSNKVKAVTKKPMPTGKKPVVQQPSPILMNSTPMQNIVSINSYSAGPLSTKHQSVLSYDDDEPLNEYVKPVPEKLIAKQEKSTVNSDEAFSITLKVKMSQSLSKQSNLKSSPTLK